MISHLATPADLGIRSQASSSLDWERSPGTSLALVDRPPIRELHLTLTPIPGENVDEMAARLAEVLRRHRAGVVRQFVFGPMASQAESLRAMRNRLGEINWPITWIEGSGCTDGLIAGMQVHAVSGADIQTLLLDGKIVGRIFDDGTARHCVVGDIIPKSDLLSAPEQARQMFEELGAALGRAGMTMKDVARTWLFLDDLLSWYVPFNLARNVFFARSELRHDAFPASTGVGGRNPHGVAIVGGAWAVRSRGNGARVTAVPSPKQCPASAYGSAFSRAVEIASPHHRQLLVSGTASIATDGLTAHVGDACGQINLTMKVLKAILQSRGMAFSDVTRATAYFKSAGDFPLFAEWCSNNGCETLPVVSARCDVCRDDLLFEIELDAVSCRE